MFGEAMRLIRVYHQVNQIDLASELDISRSYLSELESGKKNPSVDLLVRYSNFFNIPLSSIMFFAENTDETTLQNKSKRFLGKKAIDILRWIETKTELSKVA